MSFTINNKSYAGEHAGMYIGAAFKSATILDYVTLMENIKFKRVVNTVALADLVKSSNCDFTDSGSITTDERVLEPKNLQINAQFCKDDLLSDWQAAQMRAGAMNSGMSDDFAAFVMSYVGENIADYIENTVWRGDGTGDEFLGLTHVGTGLLSHASVVDVTATTLTATNIGSEIAKVVDAIPTGVYGKDDLYIYMNSKTYRLYVQHESNNGTNWYGLGSMNAEGVYTPVFQGVKIVVSDGISDDQMVAARSSNLFFGTDLISDTTQIKMLDMADLDGSNNLRLVAKFSAGIQIGIPSEIVWYHA